MSGPKLGVTLYSFTPEFHAGRYTVEQLIAKAAALDMGPGLEVIGFQSVRDPLAQCAAGKRKHALWSAATRSRPKRSGGRRRRRVL